jgi:phosphatidate cytidylyltransferase
VRTRVLTALAGIPLVLAALFLSGPALFGGIVLTLALLALHEYLRLCGVEPLLAAGTLLAAAAALGAVPVGGGAATGAAALLALCLLALWRVRDPAARLRGLAESVLGLAYIGYAMASLWLLRMVPGGPAWVFLVLAATWAGDSAAYFGGTRFGRRRLAPSLSPNKTWAGAVCGVCGSLAGGLAALPVFQRLYPGTASVALALAASLATAVSGQLGDLFESLWKRAKGVKDSGTLLPGHGGILDRIDSLLLALPTTLALVRAWGR